jgi:PAS domain-containing protein
VFGAFSALYFLIPPRHNPSAIYGRDNQLGFALYVIASGMLIVLAEMQRRAVSRAERESAGRQRAEAEQLSERVRFETTLASIDDGVIATDPLGSVTFTNRVALELTGWTQAGALGRPVEKVFAIRNEETDTAVENPAIGAMRERRISSLTYDIGGFLPALTQPANWSIAANHAVLITKVGKRIPIGSRGVSIIDASGELRGAVLIFRDLSEQRAKQTELEQLKRMVDLSQDPIIAEL